MEKRFNPSRLVAARQRNRLTRQALSGRLGVTAQMVTHYEAGRFVSDEVLTKLSQVLGFPVSFFLGDDLPQPCAENASFRSFSRMSAMQRDCALVAGGFAFTFSRWFESRFNLPAVDIPDLGSADPEMAATIVRSKWNLGVLPIKNVVHLIESRGVKVFSLVEDSRQVNAFSAWRDGVMPFVFLNTVKSSESSRFDAAHELGHLVLHRHGENKGKAAEAEADAFASAFLMPCSEMLAYAGRVRTIADVALIKKRWNVSAMAVVYRLHKVGVLTDWLYRSMCIELSSTGQRTRELDSAPRETSLVLKKIFDALKQGGITLRTIADELALPVDELHKLVFGLTPVALGTTSESPTASAPRRGHLSLVEA